LGDSGEEEDIIFFLGWRGNSKKFTIGIVIKKSEISQQGIFCRWKEKKGFVRRVSVTRCAILISVRGLMSIERSFIFYVVSFPAHGSENAERFFCTLVIASLFFGLYMAR
jgi:hypothetical protein